MGSMSGKYHPACFAWEQWKETYSMAQSSTREETNKQKNPTSLIILHTAYQ